MKNNKITSVVFLACGAALATLVVLLFIKQLRLQQQLTELTFNNTVARNEGVTGTELLAPKVVTNTDLHVELQNTTPFLVWVGDVAIHEVKVSEMEKPLPPPNPPPKIVRVLFGIASNEATLPDRYQIGTVPEGFSVTEGTPTTNFGETQYQVDISGEVNGVPYQDTTFFSFAKNINP